MKKILVIGQALPAVKQEYPYDTTMWYDWLKECGVGKEQAQRIFEFEAVYDKFPGFENGGHKVPSIEQMDEHWPVLSAKLYYADKVIILGGHAKDYLQSKDFLLKYSKKVLFLIHPSKRNFDRYQKNKQTIINSLKEFLKDEIEDSSPLLPKNYNADLVYPEGSYKD